MSKFPYFKRYPRTGSVSVSKSSVSWWLKSHGSFYKSDLGWQPFDPTCWNQLALPVSLIKYFLFQEILLQLLFTWEFQRKSFLPKNMSEACRVWTRGYFEINLTIFLTIDHRVRDVPLQDLVNSEDGACRAQGIDGCQLCPWGGANIPGSWVPDQPFLELTISRWSYASLPFW